MKPLLFAIALTLTGCITAPAPAPAPTAPTPTPEATVPPASALTKANFDAIVVDSNPIDGVTDGWTLAQVQELLGSEGTVATSSESGGISFEVRNWQEGITLITITFQDGVAVGKSQAGL